MYENIKIFEDGGKKQVSYTCTVCSKDTELFPFPFTKVSDTRKLTCPCNVKCYRYNSDQKVILAERAAKNKNLEIVGISDEIVSKTTRYSLKCVKHGNLSNVSWWQLVNTDKIHCTTCYSEFRSGDRHHNTLSVGFCENVVNMRGYEFLRTWRQDRLRYVETHCPSCKVTKISLFDNFKRGHNPCDCPKTAFKKEHEGYFYIVKWSNRVKDIYKIGITNREVSVRMKEVKSKCTDKTFDFTIVTSVKSSGDGVYELEKLVKDAAKDYNIGGEFKTIFTSGFSEMYSIDAPMVEILHSVLELSGKDYGIQ